jgi:hypothetical protein
MRIAGVSKPGAILKDPDRRAMRIYRPLVEKAAGDPGPRAIRQNPVDSRARREGPDAP